MGRNIVLGAPVLDGQAAVFLLLKDSSPLGKIGLVKSFVSVHERTSLSWLSELHKSYKSRYLLGEIIS